MGRIVTSLGGIDVCEIKVLVVGDSDWRNLNAMRAIDEECRRKSSGHARLTFDQAGAASVGNANVGSYDVVAIDDSIIGMDSGRILIGMDTPMVVFSDLARHKNSEGDGTSIVSMVVSHAIARGNLRDKIESITEQIEETSRIIAFA